MPPTPAEPPKDMAATTPKELLELAKSYSKASMTYLSAEKSKASLANAPYHFAALHAIELYLTAYLQLNSHEPKDIRDLQHNLEARTEHATKAGLILRKRTVRHLRKLTSSREYVEARYHPAALKNLSQRTQLLATLNDVKDKVEKVVRI